MWGVSRSFRRGKVYRDPIIGTMGTGSDIPSEIGDEEGTYQNVRLVLPDLGLDLVDLC